MISEELLAILACPSCKGSLEADDEAQMLLCLSCGAEYPVREGIPVLTEVDAITRKRLE